MTGGTYDQLPPGHGEAGPFEHNAPVPLCPLCGGSLRRDLHGDPLDLWCDLHGMVASPIWSYPPRNLTPRPAANGITLASVLATVAWVIAIGTVFVWVWRLS